MSPRKGETRYSDEMPGDRGNRNAHARFDLTDGYLGISSSRPGAPQELLERILLSPGQVKAMLVFLGVRKAARAAKAGAP